MFCQFFHGGGQQIAAGAAGDVVEDHRNGGSVGNGGEMLDQTLLGCLIVVGSYHQQGIGTHFAGIFGVVQHMVGVVSADTGNDRNALCHPLHGETDDLLLIFRLNGGIFAGGTHDHDGIDAVFNLEFNKVCQSVIVDAQVCLHRGHNGGSHALENRVLHISFSFVYAEYSFKP